MADTERDLLIKKMKGIIGEVNGLMTPYTSKGEAIPEAVQLTIDKKMGEADEVKVHIKLLDRVAENSDFLEESAGVSAITYGFRPTPTATEGNPEIDEKAWRELEIPLPNGKTLPIRYHVPLAVQSKDYSEVFDCYLRKGKADMSPAALKALNEGTDSSGGFLVDPDYQMNMIRKTATATVFRQYARVVQTSKDVIQWPRLKYTSASDDSTGNKFTSPARLKWTGEQPSSATVHRVSEPVFGLLDVPIHTAMASMPISRNLLEDSAFDIEGLASDLLGEAFGLGEEDVFWNGTGAGQPLGLLKNIGEADGISAVNSGDANLLTADGLIKLIYKLPAQYESGARIFWAKPTEQEVRLMKTASGVTEYVWPVEERVGGFGAPERTIQGFPISRTEFLPAIAANAYPIVFGNLQGYLIVDRVGLSIQRLDELYAETNLVLLLARKRVGGQVVEPWRIYAQKVAA